MLQASVAYTVHLDHSYCSPVSFVKEIQPKPKETKMASNGQTLNWESDIGIEFEPPTTQDFPPNSSLSPSHSIDSGFGNEFLSELNLAELNFADMDFEFLGGENTNANIADQNQKTKQRNTSSSTTTKQLSVSAATNGKSMEEEQEKNKKNALAARENRLKKKHHMQTIENEVEALRKENEVLKSKDRNHAHKVKKLEDEVTYLRNVIANQSTLSVLMKRLVTTPGITFDASSLVADDERLTSPNDDDHDCGDDDEEQQEVQERRYATRGRKRTSNAERPQAPARKKLTRNIPGGICLHVNQDKVSLELCNQCSLKSEGNSQE